MIDSVIRDVRVTCIDICSDERVAVTGHRNGTVVVWDTRTWSVSCVLEDHSEEVVCVIVLGEGNRSFSVDGSGEWRVWGAERGGTALCVIETGLKFCMFATLAFVSFDGGHFIWAPRYFYQNGRERPWKAKIIDVGGQCVVFESDEHWDLDELWAELWAEGNTIFSGIEAIGLLKEAVVMAKGSCMLCDLDGKSGGSWIISRKKSRVQCQIISAEGRRSETISIDLDSVVW